MSVRKLDLLNTKSFQRISKYLETLYDDDCKFRRLVDSIRYEVGIPQGGFKLNRTNKPPSKWIKSCGDMFLFHELIKGLCEEYQLNNDGWFDCFKGFVLFNVFTIRSEYQYDLIEINSYKENSRGSSSYPVVINISTYANERDILDYISKTYMAIIKPIQDKYRRNDVIINKIRKKKAFISERNQFIWDNRKFPRKTIMKMVTDKYGANNTVDYAYIGKIISLENKKRKEV